MRLPRAYVESSHRGRMLCENYVAPVLRVYASRAALSEFRVELRT